MLFPKFSEVNRFREMISTFSGYNHKLTCADGEFYEMQNMTSEYYPVLSPRNKRAVVYQLEDPRAMIDKEGLYFIDGTELYKGKEKITLADGILIASNTKKQLVKMGSSIIIFPDKIWYDTKTNESGLLESSFTLGAEKDIAFSLCDGSGKIIEWHSAEYYEKNDPKEGDYQMSTSNGKTSLKQYSSTTKIWSTVATTYVQISAEGIGAAFSKGDGLTLTIDTTGITWTDISNIFVNDEGNGVRSTNTVIKDVSEDAITITGIMAENHMLSGITFTAKRKCPDMSFVTECQNRLWGCSEDGHEIYCCKLGDYKNWNVFAGISTDSYSVTIGSDGKFTGAITYLGYPTFFKEDLMIRVIVSSTGGHQIKENSCRGVQPGSDKSLCIVNEVLYYKASNGICLYNGSLPANVADKLGDEKFTDAVGGSFGNRYFISMKSADGKYSLFSFDTETGIWNREDDTHALMFSSYDNDLYFVDAKDKTLKNVGGTLLFETSEKEKEFEWEVASGNIGYSMPDQKYISKINMRIQLERNTQIDFFMNYDSEDFWEHKFSMSGTSFRTFTIPILPKRCDHFRFKIKGKGTAKIYGITKTIEQGSDT